jgi:hypothetical protein
MHVDALALRLRSRTPMEASDLGVRLCQSTLGDVYRCHLAVGVPLVAFALATSGIAGWLPALVIFWAKPWLDRTILFVLSRAAFQQRTSFADLWRAQRQVWWAQLLFTWTVRRLSAWRSLTQPVYQLEGLRIGAASSRVRQIRRRQWGSALLVTQAFAAVEMALTVSLISLAFWLAPAGLEPELDLLLTGEGSVFLSLVADVAYAAAVLFVEPFYVAAGFAMYLNRRAELEAWDIEQEFRRAFA